MWVTAYLDLPADTHVRGTRFWQDVTGWGLSAPRGRHGEFASLVPPTGDSCVRVQRLGEGPARVHLDLHPDDPASTLARAVEAGATVLADRLAAERFVALRSPGGVVHCVVDAPVSARPPAADWGTHTSRVHAVVVDVPGDGFAADCDYWAAVTGTECRGFPGLPDYRGLVGLDSPLRVLLQRLGSGAAGEHVDVASSDRAAEVQRHVGLGATVVEVHPHWTVMRDPVGLAYCVTEDH